MKRIRREPSQMDLSLVAGRQGSILPSIIRLKTPIRPTNANTVTPHPNKNAPRLHILKNHTPKSKVVLADARVFYRDFLLLVNPFPPEELHKAWVGDAFQQATVSQKAAYKNGMTSI